MSVPRRRLRPHHGRCVSCSPRKHVQHTDAVQGVSRVDLPESLTLRTCEPSAPKPTNADRRMFLIQHHPISPRHLPTHHVKYAASRNAIHEPVLATLGSGVASPLHINRLCHHTRSLIACALESGDAESRQAFQLYFDLTRHGPCCIDWRAPACAFSVRHTRKSWGACQGRGHV